MQLPHKTKQFLSLAVKLLVVSLSFVVIYDAFQDLNWNLLQFISNNSHLSQLLFSGLFFSLLNWLLETLKWKTLIHDHKSIQFLGAFSETLRAHAVSIITPNKIGEFGAKASFYPKQMRKLVLKQILTGQLYQLVATCFFGILGFGVLFPELSSSLKFSISTALVMVFILGVVFSLTKSSYKWFKKLKSYFISLSILSNTTNTKALLLSVLRYLTFSHQFYFLLYFFQPELGYLEVMPVLFVIYLVSSIVPTFLLLDVTLKTSLSLVLLDGIISSEIVLMVNLMMWIFNFGLPAFVGNLLILSPKQSSLQPKKAL
jgi:hypothetical protein